ncbi:MAG: hypothetical protein J1E62_09235 [Lachnospiraceae bacterium]|nr:hypothetical protein [Lachnospiraceae bacterium]
MDIREIKKILKYRYWLDDRDMLFYPFVGLDGDFRFPGEDSESNPAYAVADNIDSILAHVFAVCSPYIPRIMYLFPNSIWSLSRSMVWSEIYESDYGNSHQNPYSGMEIQFADILLKNVILSLFFDMEQEKYKKEVESLVNYLIRYREMEYEKAENAKKEDGEEKCCSLDFHAALEYRKTQVEKSSKKINEEYRKSLQLSEEEFISSDDRDMKRDFVKPLKDFWYHRINRFQKLFVSLHLGIEENRYFQNIGNSKDKKVPSFDREIVGEIIASDGFAKSISDFSKNKNGKKTIQAIFDGKKKIRESLLNKVPSSDFEIKQPEKDEWKSCKKKIMLELQAERYLAIDLEKAIMSAYKTFEEHNVTMTSVFDAMSELNSCFIGFDWMINQPLKHFFDIIDKQIKDDYTREILIEKWMPEYLQYLRQISRVTMPLLKGMLLAQLHTHWENWYCEKKLENIKEKKADKIEKENPEANNEETTEEKIERKIYETLCITVMSDPGYFTDKTIWLMDNKFQGDENQKKKLSLWSYEETIIEKRNQNINQMRQNDMQSSDSVPISIKVDMYPATDISEINEECLKMIYKKLFSQGWMEARHLHDDLLKQLDKPFMEWGIDKRVMDSVAEQNIKILLG